MEGKSGLDRDFIEFLKQPETGCQFLDPNAYGEGDTADYYFAANGVIAEKKEFVATIPPASRREKQDPEGKTVSREVFMRGLRFGLTMDRAHYSASMRVVEKDMKKANGQIGLTKTKLGLPSARGLMIILSEENFFTAHEIYSEFLKRAMHHFRANTMDRFPHIDAGIIVWRSRVYHASGKGPEPTLPIYPYKRGDEEMRAFCDRLCSSWVGFLDRKRSVQK